MCPESKYARNGHRIAIRSASGRAIAHVEAVEGDLTLTKSVQASRHFLRYPPAIAFDAAAIDQAEALGAVGILVIDTEAARHFSSTVEEFRRLAFPLERGHGPQLALPLELWESPDHKGGARAPELTPPAQAPLFTMQEAA